MLASFLQQCNNSFGNVVRDDSQSNSMVEHIRQNRHKYVRLPLLGKPSSLGDLLGLNCFNASQTSDSVTNPLRAAGSASRRRGKITARLLKRKISQAVKAVTKMYPESFTYRLDHSAYPSVDLTNSMY